MPWLAQTWTVDVSYCSDLTQPLKEGTEFFHLTWRVLYIDSVKRLQILFNSPQYLFFFHFIPLTQLTGLIPLIRWQWKNSNFRVFWRKWEDYALDWDWIERMPVDSSGAIITLQTIVVCFEQLISHSFIPSSFIHHDHCFVKLIAFFLSAKRGRNGPA